MLASTTDAEARVMKMGDGGLRPAFNMQYAVAGSELGGPRTIVGVNVRSEWANDRPCFWPTVGTRKRRTSRRPSVWASTSSSRPPRRPRPSRSYRNRAGLAELANAHQKTHHGIAQVLVNGVAKVTCVILLNAIGSDRWTPLHGYRQELPVRFVPAQKFRAR